MMIQGYKYRIYPNKDQRVFLEKHIGSCRFVYNKLLHIKKTLYEKFKMSISEFDLNNHLTVLKNIYPWLKEVNSQSLQQASKNLNSAYNHFFKDDSGFPKKKSKKNPIQSFQIPQHYRIEGKKIWIPKVGWIKIRKVIGSNNRRKAVKQLSKIHELISNQRNDFQHKVSKKLIGENQAVAVETLNIKGMLSNHHRAQSTGDSAWYSFVLKLTYKAEWFGKTL